MIVRDAMTKDPVTCQAGDSIADVEGIIQSLKARGEKGMAAAMQKRLDARLAQIETETDKIPNPDKA